MLLLLICMLSVLLICMYYTFHRELCSPPVLFVAPFVVMCIIALINQKMWSFELHLNTFAVILFGNIFFCFGALFGDKIRLKNRGHNCIITDKYDVKNWKYAGLLLLQLFCYAVKLRYIINYGVSNGIERNLSMCLVYYNNTMKFTTEEVIKYSSWLSLCLDICVVWGYVCACMLAQHVLLKHKDKVKLFWILINYVIAILGGMSSGGRGGAIQLLLAFIFAYIILYQRKFNWKRLIPMKTFVAIGSGLGIIIAIFFFSLTWIGRNEVHDAGKYLANYIGAQIFNLDYRLNSMFSQSQIWGQETFFHFIEKFANWFGIVKWQNYHTGADSVFIAGYSTGNVQTAFYSYVKDFGAFGVALPPMIFGFLSQIIYKYAKRSSKKYSINPELIFYLFVAYIITFGFFADKFGGMLFTFNTVKRLIILICLDFFLFRLRFRKTKIIILNPSYQ